LQCFKTHSSCCPQALTSKAAIRETEEVQPPNDHASPKPTLAASLTRHPKLVELFRRYPSLKSELRAVFEATMEDHPHTDQSGGRRSSRRGSRGRNSTSTQSAHGLNQSSDKRLYNAMCLLDEKLVASSAEANGFKAFADLIAETTKEALNQGSIASSSKSG